MPVCASNDGLVSARARGPRLRAPAELTADQAALTRRLYDEREKTVQLLDEAVWVATPLDYLLAGRTSVSIDELADQPFVTAHKGHWHRRLLGRLFAGKGLMPKIVCEGDEPSAIADLIGAGLGIGLIPALARRATIRTPIAWIAVDDPGCRRTLTLFWGADSHLSTAARLMRTTIIDWNWSTGEPREKR